jgi:hypothetical protein
MERVDGAQIAWRSILERADNSSGAVFQNGTGRIGGLSRWRS